MKRILKEQIWSEFIDLMDVKGWDTPDMLMERATVTIR